MKIVRFTSALLVLGALAACGGDSTAPQATIFGTYTLKTIDGTALPVHLTTASGTALVTAGSVTFNTDHTCSESGMLTGPNGNASLNLTCTFTLSDSTLTMLFSSNGGFTDTGSWSGNIVQVSDGGHLSVYTK